MLVRPTALRCLTTADMSGHPPAHVPQTLGRYELLVPVARGGMGQVWAGRLRGARGFNKLVAVKTLLALPGAEGRLEKMLLEEARIASLIHHGNVVQTLELGEHEGTLYLVMEWVDGESLSDVLERVENSGGIPLDIAVNLVGQTLLGLHAAHELTDESGAPLAVVHRDVSPHNVLVTCAGVAKLVDFGIAKAMNQPSVITEAGEVKGKFSYMSPEQIRCEPVDRRADVFAMGIMLYLLTTGHHPFTSHHPAAILHRISSAERAKPPSQLVSGYSRALESVVLKALEKSPAQRWQTAEQMLTALQSALPSAFAPNCTVRVKEFISGIIGERTARRRERLRKAQLAADGRAQDVSAPAEPNHPPPRSSSLRALSVDTDEGLAASRSGAVTVRASLGSPRSAVLIAVVTALLVSGSVTAFRAVRDAGHAVPVVYGAPSVGDAIAIESPRPTPPRATVSAAEEARPAPMANSIASSGPTATPALSSRPPTSSRRQPAARYQR